MTQFKKYILCVLLICAATIASGQNQNKDLKSPKGFVLYLVQLAKEGNKKEWPNILSKEIKEKYKNKMDLHFTAWSEGLIYLSKKYDDKLDTLIVTYDKKINTIKIDKEFRIIVVKENREFRINEN